MSSEPASETTDHGPPRRYLLIVAGLLSAAAAWGSMYLSLGPLQIPPSEEAIALGSDYMNDESVARAEMLLLQIDEQNSARLLAMLFGFCGAIFGVFEGLRRGSFGGVMSGLLVGAIFGGASGWLLGPPLRSLQGYMASEQFDGMVATIGLHSVVWVLAAIIIAISIGCAAFSLRRAASVSVPAIVGGVIGALVFAFGAGLFFGVAPTERMRFPDFVPQLLWAIAPPVCIGLFVARATGLQRHGAVRARQVDATEPASAEPV